MHSGPLLGLSLSLLTAAAWAVPTVESTFDADSEGWQALNGVFAQAWQPSGGNPGGFYEAADLGGGMVWVFQAPPAFTGDLSWAAGGSLGFDLKVTTTAFPMLNDWGDVKFIGSSGLTIVTDAGPNPGTDWTSYSVPLGGLGWHLDNMTGPVASAADIASVLADVQFLRIRGEFSAVFDHGGLDNVVLAAAIPEPATWALLAGGLAGLGAVVRRRRAEPVPARRVG